LLANRIFRKYLKNLFHRIPTFKNRNQIWQFITLVAFFAKRPKNVKTKKIRYLEGTYAFIERTYAFIERTRFCLKWNLFWFQIKGRQKSQRKS